MGGHVVIAEFDGTAPEGLLIAFGTNPWVEVGGVPVDWTLRPLPPSAEPNDCEVCADEPVPGALSAMDTPQGIQSCDTCQRIPGDLEAALVLARRLGGVVRFETDARDLP